MTRTEPAADPGRFIYEQRSQGELWSLAAHRAGVSLLSGLIAARDYADREGLAWPPSGNGPRKELKPTSELRQLVRRFFPPPTEMAEATTQDDVGAVAYRCRSEGMSWKLVADAAGCGNPTRAIYAAQRYAAREKLPWPIPQPPSSLR